MARRGRGAGEHVVDAPHGGSDAGAADPTDERRASLWRGEELGDFHAELGRDAVKGVHRQVLRARLDAWKVLQRDGQLQVVARAWQLTRWTISAARRVDSCSVVGGRRLAPEAIDAATLEIAKRGPWRSCDAKSPKALAGMWLESKPFVIQPACKQERVVVDVRDEHEAVRDVIDYAIRDFAADFLPDHIRTREVDARPTVASHEECAELCRIFDHRVAGRMSCEEPTLDARGLADHPSTSVEDSVDVVPAQWTPAFGLGVEARWVSDPLCHQRSGGAREYFAEGAPSGRIAQVESLRAA